MANPRLALGLAAVMMAAPAQAAGLRYLLWDVSFLGLDENTGRLIRAMLDGELRRVLGSDYVVEPSALTPEIRDAVESCGRSTDCLAQAGGALGVDRVMIGVATVLGDAAAVRMKVIDAATGSALDNVQQTFSGDRRAMLETMQTLVLKLVDPSKGAGALLVDIALDGAVVYVDGQERGSTPLREPIGALTPGEHAFKVTSPVIKDYVAFVTIYSGKTSTVRVNAEQIVALQAEIQMAEQLLVQPLYKRWWFWAAASGAVGAAAATAFLVYGRRDGDGTPTTTLGTVDFR